MGGNSYPQSISSGRQDVRTWQVAEVGSTVALMITRSSKSASSGSVQLPPGGKRTPYYQSCHFQLSVTLYLCRGAEAVKGSCFIRDIIFAKQLDLQDLKSKFAIIHPSCRASCKSTFSQCQYSKTYQLTLTFNDTSKQLLQVVLKTTEEDEEEMH